MDELLLKLKNSKTLKLYHGSRGGLRGDIKPKSRKQCDFGSGFYMGTLREQAEMLIADNDNPVLYEMELHLDKIPMERILCLEQDEWLYTVLANRKSSEEFNKLELAERWLDKTENCDVIIGRIADDKMKDAIRLFNENLLTKEALFDCLQYVQYGYQIVLKTDFACQQVKVINKKELSENECVEIKINSEAYRDSIKNVIHNANLKYRNGILLQDIIDEEMEQNKNVEGG